MSGDEHSTRTSQNVVIKFAKNWIMVWYGLARRLAFPLRLGAVLIGFSVAGTLYLMVPAIAYTVHRYGWGALLTTNEYEMNGPLVLFLTVVWVAVTASIAVAASRTWEGDARE